MKLEVLSKSLSIQLNEIASGNNSMLERAYRSIEVCRNLLSKFKKQVIKEGFDTMATEIRFFKHTKQVPLIQLIYFSEIHSFELQFPKADKHSQLKTIKKKVNKINRFFLYNLDFGRYIDAGHTHFDKEYFTRDYLDSYHITTSKFYFQDPEFCTPRDMLLGKYKAYQKLLNYLDERRFQLKKSLNKKRYPFKRLHWPFSNTDYVELIYALHAKGLGAKNNLSIVKISDYISQIFDVEPKDIYKTYQDIKYRKKSRTLFLDELSTSLLSEMDRSGK
tara:strand:- start:975 stop:1802 length:828 start_codon:yes stop_codon:yes gene_type:complete